MTGAIYMYEESGINQDCSMEHWLWYCSQTTVHTHIHTLNVVSSHIAIQERPKKC